MNQASDRERVYGRGYYSRAAAGRVAVRVLALIGQNGVDDCIPQCQRAACTRSCTSVHSGEDAATQIPASHAMGSRL